MNELIKLDQVNIDYTPATLIIRHKDALDQNFSEFISKYENIVVTEETLKDAKNIKAKVNALKRAFDDKRKEQKKIYNKPLNAFENEMKEYTAKLDEVYQSINNGVKFFEDQQRNKRKQKVLAMIAEVCELNAVNPDDIEVQKNWLLKSTSDGKIMEEIVEAMRRQKHVNKDIELITTYCTKLDLPEARYIEFAKTLGYEDARKIADKDYAQRLERKKEKQLLKQALVEEEREKIIEANGKQVDSETGEIVKELQILTIRLKGTKEQLDKLGKFIKSNGIEVVKASKREIIIER